MQAWRRGDHDAGRRLVERHFDSVYRFFANKVPDGVDDLIQQTFEACVRDASSLRDDGSFRAFLFTIARRRLAADLDRRIKSRSRDAGLDDSFAVEQLSPGTVVARKDEDRLMLRALRQIPLDLQIALELHYWENMSSREVGEVLGLADGTVRSRLRRGRSLLLGTLAELAREGGHRPSTSDDLERWARRVRECVFPPSGE